VPDTADGLVPKQNCRPDTQPCHPGEEGVQASATRSSPASPIDIFSRDGLTRLSRRDDGCDSDVLSRGSLHALSGRRRFACGSSSVSGRAGLRCPNVCAPYLNRIRQTYTNRRTDLLKRPKACICAEASCRPRGLLRHQRTYRLAKTPFAPTPSPLQVGRAFSGDQAYAENWGLTEHRTYRRITPEIHRIQGPSRSLLVLPASWAGRACPAGNRPWSAPQGGERSMGGEHDHDMRAVTITAMRCHPTPRRKTSMWPDLVLEMVGPIGAYPARAAVSPLQWGAGISMPMIWNVQLPDELSHEGLVCGRVLFRFAPQWSPAPGVVPLRCEGWTLPELTHGAITVHSQSLEKTGRSDSVWSGSRSYPLILDPAFA